MTQKKFDFRNANKSDVLALSRLLLTLQKSLSPAGYKITIKKTSSKAKTNAGDQKITQIS